MLRGTFPVHSTFRPFLCVELWSRSYVHVGFPFCFQPSLFSPTFEMAIQCFFAFPFRNGWWVCDTPVPDPSHPHVHPFLLPYPPVLPSNGNPGPEREGTHRSPIDPQSIPGNKHPPTIPTLGEPKRKRGGVDPREVSRAIRKGREGRGRGERPTHDLVGRMGWRRRIYLGQTQPAHSGFQTCMMNLTKEGKGVRLGQTRVGSSLTVPSVGTGMSPTPPFGWVPIHPEPIHS